MKKKMKRDIKTEIERIKKKLKRNCDCEECNIERARLPLLEVLSKSLTRADAMGIIKNCQTGVTLRIGLNESAVHKCHENHRCARCQFLIDFFAKKNMKLEKEAKPSKQI